MCTYTVFAYAQKVIVMTEVITNILPMSMKGEEERARQKERDLWSLF